MIISDKNRYTVTITLSLDSLEVQKMARTIEEKLFD